ncbi:MAG TPA: LON peptidase substrate-binding domain-containing protein [Candidatus Limnocylindrales bacterium]
MRLPLFPLHTVLAPGIALPLHIFEERYRVMVRRCLDESAPFGIVLIREGSEVALRNGEETELAIAGVGTFAEIREASKFADGRWNLLVVGTGRFSVLGVDADSEPYLVADVEPLPDEVGDEEVAEQLVARVGARFIRYLRELQPREGELGLPVDVQVEVEVDDDPVEEVAVEVDGDADEDAAIEALRVPDDPSALSFLLTGIVQAELDRKQALLEASTAEERLRDLDGLLRRELDLLDQRLGLYIPDRSSLADRLN